MTLMPPEYSVTSCTWMLLCCPRQPIFYKNISRGRKRGVEHARHDVRARAAIINVTEFCRLLKQAACLHTFPQISPIQVIFSSNNWQSALFGQLCGGASLLSAQQHTAQPFHLV